MIACTHPARHSGVPGLVAMAERALAAVAAEEEQVVIGSGPHTSINRVMFALALDPSVLVSRLAGLRV